MDTEPNFQKKTSKKFGMVQLGNQMDLTLTANIFKSGPMPTP